MYQEELICVDKKLILIAPFQQYHIRRPKVKIRYRDE